MYGLFLILLLFQACAAVQDKKLVENGLTLRYLPVNAIGNDIEKTHLQHPVQITEDLIRVHLGSLWYEDLTSLGKKGRVFSESDVNKASRLIAKALNQAKPDNIVQVELAGASGPTEVEVFVENDKIHWRFQLIKGAVFTCNIANADCMRVNWRLTPKGNQHYFSAHKLLGTKNMENWIVANINPLAKPTKETKPEPSGFEERLLYLKQLHEKGLIGDEEFTRNQKKIMDEKF